VLAKKTIPHYSYVDECDVTDLVRLRQALKEAFAQQGLKLTLLAFIIKAVVAALKEVRLSTRPSMRGEEIVLHDRYHVGVAVATAHGLIVPVVHDAERKDIGQIASEIERLSQEAAAARFASMICAAARFTVPRSAALGGYFDARHQSSGSGDPWNRQSRETSGLDANGNVRPADAVYLSLSCDHRVVDGAVAAVFCNAVIRRTAESAALPCGRTLSY